VRENRNEVLALRESGIVNCTGLGAKKINDRLMVPIKGRFVLLKAQHHQQYFYSSGRNVCFSESRPCRPWRLVRRRRGQRCPRSDEMPTHLGDGADVFAGVMLKPHERESWMMKDK
jgi:hypothetical protein